jgi:hypothetical protein
LLSIMCMTCPVHFILVHLVKWIPTLTYDIVVFTFLLVNGRQSNILYLLNKIIHKEVEVMLDCLPLKKRINWRRSERQNILLGTMLWNMLSPHSLGVRTSCTPKQSDRWSYGITDFNF